MRMKVGSRDMEGKDVGSGMELLLLVDKAFALEARKELFGGYKLASITIGKVWEWYGSVL